MKVIAIANVNLGSPTSRSAELLKAIRHEYADILVIVGDLFHSSSPERWDEQSWDFLDYLREETRPISGRARKQIVWCEGNHDKPFLDSVSKLVGAKVIPENDYHQIDIGKESYVFVHGHTFDRAKGDHKVYLELDYHIDKMLGFASSRNSQVTSKSIRSGFGVFLDRAEIEVMDNAIKFMKRAGGSSIVCGHVNNKENVSGYFNIGGTKFDCNHYMVIDDTGICDMIQL